MKIDWQKYESKCITRVSQDTYAVKISGSVSDLVPKVEKLFTDRHLTLEGHYNKRGYCVGYILKFKGNPSISEGGFYILLDYMESDSDPKKMSFPPLPKKDTSISLVKFGTNYKNRMYAFIYRRKKD